MTSRSSGQEAAVNRLMAKPVASDWWGRLVWHS